MEMIARRVMGKKSAPINARKQYARWGTGQGGGRDRYTVVVPQSSPGVGWQKSAGKRPLVCCSSRQEHKCSGLLFQPPKDQGYV
ncbi:hypothetical protein FF2_018357 [Malus domestica]